jgi:hypothetical protein
MTSADDFSPIVASGTIEPARRFRGRRTDDGVPPAASGVEHIVCDARGAAIKGASELTPGERRHADAREWISVDKGTHPLRYTFELRDTATQAGLVVTVTVNASVIDAEVVAQQRFASVKETLEPALHTAVGRAWRGRSRERTADKLERSAQLDLALQDAEALLDEELSSGRHAVDNWLAFTCTSVDVAFDAKTQKHYDDLVSGTQQVEVSTITHRLQHGETLHEIELRRLWRESLQDQLLDPSLREFEAVFADPSPENIQRAVAQVTANESAIRSEVIPILETLVDKYYVDKGDRLLKVIVETVIHGLQGKPVPRDAEVLLGRAASGERTDEPPAALPEANEDKAWDSGSTS